MIRVDGDSPADTDLNLEKKEVEMIRKNRPRKGADGNGKKKKDKLPGILIGILALLMLLAGGVYGAARFGLIPDEYREKYLGNLVPSTLTPTPTIDWVRESMTVYELTAEAEKIAAVAATVDAWPTQTPYPTFTPVFIDLDEGRATETSVPVSVPDEEIKEEPTDTAEESDWTDETPEEQPTEEATEAVSEQDEAAVAQMLAEMEEEKAEAVVKEDYVDEKSGAEMIYIPAGSFLLGSDLNVDYYASPEEESPQLRVYLDGYWIGKTEVTNGQYLKCVEAGVCDQSTYMSIYNRDLENNPLTYVTWDQAERFCSWIGGHLPTEYEWEKAARGTDGRIYPWGEEEPSLENDLANVPNYVNEEGYGYDLFPVGSFPNGQSPYGLMDMAGNVWEWTSTWYSLNYYETLAAEEEISGSVVKNPRGPENGSSQVIRGGSAAATEVNNYPSYMRAANRSYLNMSSSYYVGFRCMVPDTGDARPGEGPLPGEGPRPDEPGPRP